MEQLHTALHSHPHINVVRVVDGDFVDLDSMMDKFYKHPASGTVNKTHVFSMSRAEPGILKLKITNTGEQTIQNLKTTKT